MSQERILLKEYVVAIIKIEIFDSFDLIIFVAFFENTHD